MSFDGIYDEFLPEMKHQSISFGCDANLRTLVFQRIREVEKEISELEPNPNTDPNVFMRHATELHSRKQELKDFFNLLQRIKNENAPQPLENTDV